MRVRRRASRAAARVGSRPGRDLHPRRPRRCAARGARARGRPRAPAEPRAGLARGGRYDHPSRQHARRRRSRAKSPSVTHTSRAVRFKSWTGAGPVRRETLPHRRFGIAGGAGREPRQRERGSRGRAGAVSFVERAAVGRAESGRRLRGERRDADEGARQTGERANRAREVNPSSPPPAMRRARLRHCRLDASRARPRPLATRGARGKGHVPRKRVRFEPAAPSPPRASGRGPPWASFSSPVCTYVGHRLGTARSVCRESFAPRPRAPHLTACGRHGTFRLRIHSMATALTSSGRARRSLKGRAALVALLRGGRLDRPHEPSSV